MMAMLALFFVKYMPLFHLIPNKKPRLAAGFFVASTSTQLLKLLNCSAS
jgi:hypothetical protein